jgi:hypothetical protein
VTREKLLWIPFIINSFIQIITRFKRAIGTEETGDGSDYNNITADSQGAAMERMRQLLVDALGDDFSSLTRPSTTNYFCPVSGAARKRPANPHDKVMDKAFGPKLADPDEMGGAWDDGDDGDEGASDEEEGEEGDGDEDAEESEEEDEMKDQPDNQPPAAAVGGGAEDEEHEDTTGPPWRRHVSHVMLRDTPWAAFGR